ncbi:3137_t:CDS:2, partial [Gigaspora margarita]
GVQPKCTYHLFANITAFKKPQGSYHSKHNGTKKNSQSKGSGSKLEMEEVNRKPLDPSLENLYQTEKKLRKSCQIKIIELQRRICNYLDINKELSEENNNLKKDLSSISQACIVCLQRPREYALVSCGHFYYCW